MVVVMLDTTAGTLKRDVRIIGLVGSAHFFSHFFQLTLPPLFPLIKETFGVPYVALGFMMSLMYASSGIGQTISGFLVDRFGAARGPVLGTCLFAASMAAAGMAPTYWALLPIAVLAGLGNSVFHPADYSIFNASVDARRLGRPCGAPSLCGRLRSAAGPAAPHQAPLAAAPGALPAFLRGSAAGVPLAAFIAHPPRRHDLVAACGMST